MQAPSFHRSTAKVKVVHVIDSLDPTDGGPSSGSIRLAAAQAALGQEVHIVTYAVPGSEQRFRDSVKRVPCLEAVRIHYGAYQTYAEQLLALSAQRLLDRVIAEADFVHLHGVWEPILRMAAAVSRARGVPYCISVHGMLDPWSLDQKRFKKAIALRLGYREMLDAAAFLRVLNEDEDRLLAPLKLKSPTCIVPNGVFIDEIEPLPPRGSFARLCPAVADKPFIFFIGRLHQKKGLDYLASGFAAVASRLPQVALVVAGPDGGAQSAFEAAIARHDLSDRVHLVGPLYGAAKIAALNDAACFCLPSRQEGFSVAILEALACGVPVIVSQQCHFPELAAAGAGEVVSLSGSELADALLRLLSAPQQCRRDMGRAARELVQRDYLWARVAERMIAAYDRYSAARGSGLIQAETVPCG
jgi:glycosyltransferase involved in cell wall biosynthesis